MFRNNRKRKEIALPLCPLFYSWKYRNNTASKKNTVSKGYPGFQLGKKVPGRTEPQRADFLLLLANYESYFSR
jgi:hypothetical protein